MRGNFWDGFKKQAFFASGPAGVLGGAVSGYHSGRSAAGTTANALSRKGFKTNNEEAARNVARVTAVLGAVLGISKGLKHREKIIQMAAKHLGNHPEMTGLYHAAVPFLAGTGGGIAAGVGTGAITSLRGAFSPHGEKAASAAAAKAFASGLLGTTDFGLETLSRRAGSSVRKAATPVLAAAGAAAGTKKYQKKEAGVASLIGTVTGVKDVRRGYKLIDKAVRKGHILQSGAVLNHAGERAKAMGGKAMAGGLGRMALTGAGTAYLLRKKDGGQTQGY